MGGFSLLAKSYTADVPVKLPSKYLFVFIFIDYAVVNLGSSIFPPLGGSYCRVKTCQAPENKRQRGLITHP